ncbi:MAG: long-chain-fatty-acyl-CoA reductase [Proteobacteria bacterium]|nr:long-chain-fatty-acyl-CoA reductase [Pseudomonadota bacterium]HQR04243.1 acyl-CoA reductase [Rhodocyclaceae bacterium]
MAEKIWRIPLVIRGEVIDECDTPFGGRRGGVSFVTPDVRRYMDRLTLDRPSQMADLYQIGFDDIVDYLARLGERLHPDTNPHMQESFELARLTSGLSDSVLRHHYEWIPFFFRPDVSRETAERLVGIANLEGWVEQVSEVNPALRVRVRAFGARCVHVIAGNVPTVASGTIFRNAITRSDAIIKTPSNDPLTAVALARTMVEMDPDHPITKHVSVAYWKGGDETVESALYQPRQVEKIVAWGGFDSIRHITRYLQPGIDLITLDPKHSASIIGAEAFADETTMRHVARRLALDIGVMNQEGCVNARVIYVQSGTDAEGLARLNRFGKMTFDALQGLPASISTAHKAFDPSLKEEIDGLRFAGDEFRVFGGKSNEGAIIVSQHDAPVDFSRMLACRVGNLVPIDDLETAALSVSAYTQTIGIYPESLKEMLRDRLAYQGAQRFVSLGGAGTLFGTGAPQDGIEPVRRMCKWIVDEEADPALLESLATGEAIQA